MEDRRVLDDTDVQTVIARYRSRIREHGVTFSSLNSGSPEKNKARHAVHASAISTDYCSVLDVGCGMGGLYSHLRDLKRNVGYTGYDLVPEYVAECSALFPEGRFEVRNIFSDGIGGEFDSIVMSQVLNNRYTLSRNMDVLAEALNLTFRHCRLAVSIDMMSDDVEFRNEDLFYYSATEVFRLARGLTRRVVLRHDYRPHEFCIQLFKRAWPGFVD